MSSFFTRFERNLGYIIIFLTVCSAPRLTAQTNANADWLEHQNLDSLKQVFEVQRLENVEMIKDVKIEHMVIHSDQDVFGYLIFLDGHLLIEQKTIPAIPGTHGFSSQADAEKIALVAIDKIKSGFIPPTLTVEDIQHSGVDIPR